MGFHRSVTEVGRPMLNVDFTTFHWLSPGEGKKKASRERYRSAFSAS